MTQDEKDYISECKECLAFFSIDYNKDPIMLTSGGNSVIMRDGDGAYSKRMLGHSLNSIVMYVAEITGKKTKWADEY